VPRAVALWNEREVHRYSPSLTATPLTLSITNPCLNQTLNKVSIHNCSFTLRGGQYPQDNCVDKVDLSFLEVFWMSICTDVDKAAVLQTLKVQSS